MNLAKRSLLVLSYDIIISLFATYIALSLRLESYHIPQADDILLYIICILVFIPIYFYFGVYNSLIKFINLYFIKQILLASLTYSLFLLSILSLISFSIENKYFNLLDSIIIPRSIGIIQPIIFCFFVCLFRIVLTSQSRNRSYIDKPNLIIFGAGSAGSQLLELIHIRKTYNIIAFIDNDPAKYSMKISGIEIFPEEKIQSLISKKNVENIIIAIPSLQIDERRKIVKKLEGLNLNTKILPDISDLMDQKVRIADIRSLNIDDLLEREVDTKLNTDNSISLNKKILITGAGGSIGSELCKQIIYENPSELILLDHSEFNLYKIKEELDQIKILKKELNPIKITPVLLSINNVTALEFLFKNLEPNIIFHAAAYKHVNLVEVNVIESIRNNFFGTLNLVKLSKKFEVQKFILISSDKAVRPTNIMGATKRMSELAVQAFADTKNHKTIFSIVRFGNVLASSGSVINKFDKQIQNREALTVTDEKVTRYFMTIYEAVYLILETSKMSLGGEVFLLNMGEPIKIIDLAKKMVRLNGLTIKNNENPNGEIEITYTGLKPGEKLYEELLIDSKSIPSSNKNIYFAKEEFISLNELENLSQDLEHSIANFNLDRAINILEKYVSGFKHTN